MAEKGPNFFEMWFSHKIYWVTEFSLVQCLQNLC
jgi:hypothetical protein